MATGIRSICLAILASSACLFPGSTSARDNIGPLLIENVSVVDPSKGTSPAQTIAIRGGEIVYAGPAGTAPRMPHARRIDGKALFALPGLADMHVHIWDEAELGAYLAHGVTTVRNMSGMPFHLRLAKRIEADEVSGPRLLTTGPILNSPGPNEQINHQMLMDAASARAAVKAHHAAGYERLKVYSNLRREPYEALLDEAKTLGIAITGHTPEGERLEGIPTEQPFVIAFDEILDDGFETIEHSESILWHGLSDKLDETAARVVASRIANTGVPVTPTLVAHHNLVRMAAGKEVFATRQGTDWLNPVTQATEQGAIAFWQGQDPADHEDKDRFIGRLTRIMADEGVLLVSGSDAGIFSNVPGRSLLKELDLLERAGFSPREALLSSTANVAQVLGEKGKSGCLEAGCIADIALYRCDPSEDLSCLDRPAVVIRKGHYYNRPALDVLLQRASEHDTARTIDNIVEGMAAQGTPIDPALLAQ